MDRMIDDLFLLSKLDLEQERFHLETVPLESFYRQTMSELQMEYESAGVRLTSEYEAGQGDVVTMDVQKMRRVMLNIVGNSVKFMDKKEPHIHVYFGRQSEDWVFAVTDNGPGMGPNELERIFDRFYRADTNRNQNVAGSGLGLAIVKQIIANHGGTIHARSEPGQFMTVMISIPMKRDSIEARRT
jgi:signal transduction histidine kinase